MKLLFIADPLHSFKIYKDTTFAMMREAQRRAEPDARGGSGDERDLPGETTTHAATPPR